MMLWGDGMVEFVFVRIRIYGIMGFTGWGGWICPRRARVLEGVTPILAFPHQGGRDSCVEGEGVFGIDRVRGFCVLFWVELMIWG